MTGQKWDKAASNSFNCEVCDESLGILEASVQSISHYKVCRSFECKNILEKSAGMEPQAFKFFLARQSKFIKERKQCLIVENKRIATLEEKHKAEHQLILSQTLAAHPDIHSEQIQVVEIPSGLKKTSQLKSQRIEQYRVFLQDLIAQASRYTSKDQIPCDNYLETRRNRRIEVDTFLTQNPGIKAMSDTLCTMCKGGCCTRGGNKAYLSVLTIRRYMDANPDLSADEVLHNYLLLLSPSTITNSCINQTNKGCGLPRDMRSDVCNGYYCDSIVAYHNADKHQDGLPSVLAIQRANTDWNRLKPEVDKQVLDYKLYQAENF